MGIFKAFFSKSDKPDKQMEKDTFNFHKLIESDNINNSIIEFDNYIGCLCAYGDDMSKLNDYQKNFYYNQCIEREINNGGFSQFYSNSSGDFAHEVIVSLKAVGADKTAETVLKANGLFPDGKVPKDREKRQEILEKIEENASDKWGELEEKFMAYEEDLNSLNMAYIKNNKEKFNPDT
ncbi:MAG: DMP19 family protein [Desulfococcaceae bacterium]